MGLSIEAIAEQFITVGTKDYDLVIDIGGDPDTVKVTGLPEGFYQDWDAANDELHIKSDTVTRLINGQEWKIELIKGSKTLLGKVLWNAIQAAAILQTLPTLHLYKGVPLNFDIIIHNIPPQVIPKTLLIGIKSEQVAYGLNFKGQLPADADVTVTTENLTIVLPESTGHASVTKNYPFRIESGSPPTLGTPTFTPKGNYGELTFTDVQHALGYEWGIQRAGEETVWHFFNSDRPMIDQSQVEVTPGNLSVTLKFPNIPNAAAYEYQAIKSGENPSGFWTRFTGTLQKNMIRTIIPNLEEGVQYDVMLRVASPWVGTPITLKIRGGRQCYVLNITSTQSWLYLFSTGHADNTQATRIKRMRLPSVLEGDSAELDGLAVNAAGDVFILNTDPTDTALYTFLAATIESAADGSTLTHNRRNPLPAGTWKAYGLAAYKNELYVYFFHSAPSGWDYLRVMPVPTTDGTPLTTTRGSGVINNPAPWGMSVTDETVYWCNTSYQEIERHDRELYTAAADITLYASTGTTKSWDSHRSGLKVIGDSFYTVTNANDFLRVYRINPEVHASRYIEDFTLSLPSGLTSPRFLDIIT